MHLRSAALHSIRFETLRSKTVELVLKEGVLITLLLAAVLPVQMVLSASFYLLTRNFWLDEIVTDVLVSDQSVSHSLGAIAGGLDTNPPVYHLLLRAFCRLVGHGGETTLRLFSLFSVLAALVALYVNLREIYLPLTALAGVFAVWSHPLLLRCAFRARMYAPWFAAVVWFAYLLGRSWNASPQMWVRLLLACLSFLTCTLQTVGALSLGIVLAANLLFHHSAKWDWNTIGWASLGAVAFLAWIPFLWKQNFANPVTWIKAPTLRNIADFASGILIPRLLATTILFGVGLAVFFEGSSATLRTLGNGSSNFSTPFGLAALIVLPIVLIAFSILVQPLLDDRYAIPAVAAFAPTIAAVVSPLSPSWLAALLAMFFMISATHLFRLSNSSRAEDRKTAELIEAIRRNTSQETVFFERLHELTVVSRYAKDIAERCYALDFEAGHVGGVDELLIANRNHARLFLRFYSCFNMMPWESARRLPRLFLVPSVEAALEESCSSLETRYKDFKVLPLEAGLYELTRG